MRTLINMFLFIGLVVGSGLFNDLSGLVITQPIENLLFYGFLLVANILCEIRDKKENKEDEHESVS